MPWEYKMVDLPVKSEDALNQLGSQGWELVAVTTQTRASHPTAYLKRQTSTTSGTGTGTGTNTGTGTTTGTGSTTGTTTTNPIISIGLK